MPYVNASWRVAASRFGRSRMAFFWMNVPLVSVRRDWSQFCNMELSIAWTYCVTSGFRIRSHLIRKTYTSALRKSPACAPERELSTLFSMICKQVTRLRTEKPRTGAVRAGFPTVVAWADRV